MAKATGKGQAMDAIESNVGLAKVEPRGELAMNDERWDLIRRTYAKDASPDEFALFRSVAEREGLDPFTRQIHFVKRRAGDVSFVVGVHGLVGRLNRVAGFRGIQSAAVCKADKFTCDPVGGAVQHTFGADRGPVVGAWARGQIGDRFVVVRFVSMDEYRGEGPLWRSKPATMIEKVAIAQCARALAPEELRGLYAAEEFGGASKPNDAVDMPEAKAPREDPDAAQIAGAVKLIKECVDLEALDTAVTGIRKDAEAWTPSARRLFKSCLEERREQLRNDLAASIGKTDAIEAVYSDADEDGK